jgi:hypothetical protein
MKTECIIASFNYSDFLSVTLPLNRDAFDRVVVYTKREDLETQRVCSENGVEFVVTESFCKDGAKFNRGAVYNEAIASLVFKEWVCLMDSDVVLPSQFKQLFSDVNPSQELFYGARRYNVETPELWKKIKENPNTLSDVLIFRGFGYGYFQMFHHDSSVFRKAWRGLYPESFSCSESDWMFRNQWGHEIYDPPTNGSDDCHKVKEVRDYGSGLLRCLPFPVIHLGTTGVNSTERKTVLWK